MKSQTRKNIETSVLILAAGEGKRMGKDLPKVMHEIKDKPMLAYVFDAVKNSGVCDLPFLVVSEKNKSLIQHYFGEAFEYVVQTEQLGTGHAVAAAEERLKNLSKHIMVLYGDMPFLRSASIRALARHHSDTDAVITLMTTLAPDFEDWRRSFESFGRIVRNDKGAIERIVEYKDANFEELHIKELSTGFFCFRGDWLWEHLKKLNNDNRQSEHYLVDVIPWAIQEGLGVRTINVGLKEAYGINSKEDLVLAEALAPDWGA
ncbi:MAG: NTP transferase domain-containing protein [Candidatus Magasanikbacteria bacterium]|nr:NTP transferase domain-containing protein [Candidatus Magasanikbacteria bacterium]